MNNHKHFLRFYAIFMVSVLWIPATGISQQNCIKSSEFVYEKWHLKGWGLGIYDDIYAGPTTFDHQIKIIKCGTTFSVKEVAEAWANGHQFGVWMEGPVVDTYRNSNGQPLYLFGYILTKPDDIIGKSPSARQNNYSYNDGIVVFPFDTRTAGQHTMELMLRSRDKEYWEESSWVTIGKISFIVTE